MPLLGRRDKTLIIKIEKRNKGPERSESINNFKEKAVNLHCEMKKAWKKTDSKCLMRAKFRP